MKRQIPLSWLLAGLILLAAGLVRLVSLGGIPLTVQEAEAALAAADWAGMASDFWVSQPSNLAPAYQSLTGGLMTLFGAREMIARLVPALFGLGLVLLPLALDKRVSWPARLLTLTFLSFSATTLTLSRTASGTTIAAFGLALVLLAALRKRAELAGSHQIMLGAGLGIALAGGSSTWMGLFGLAISVGLGLAIPAANQPEGDEEGAGLRDLLSWKVALVGLLVGLLLSSAFGTRLEGVAQLLQAPAVWLLGWTGSADWPFFSALLVPLLYEPLLLVFGGYGIFRSLRSGDPIERKAALWSIGALLAYLVYPGRQPEHLIWAVIPLAVLAANQLEGIMDQLVQLSSPLSSLLLALVLITVLSFAYLQLESSVAGFGLASLDRGAQLAFALSALAFSGLLILLFGIGWSWSETLIALAIALFVSLGALSINAAWSLNFKPGEPRATELWRKQVSTAHLQLLEDTLADIAKWYVGRADRLPVQVQGKISAPLAWALREQRAASSDQTLESPPVVLSAETSSVELPAEYLGQAFAISETWGWQGILPPEPLRWWLDRQSPVHEARWILFVRTDVAELGGQTEISGTE